MRKAKINPLVGFRMVNDVALSQNGFKPNKAKFNPSTRQAICIVKQSKSGNDFPLSKAALDYMCAAERAGRCVKGYIVLADSSGNIFLDPEGFASHFETCCEIERRLKGIEPRQGNGDARGGNSYGAYWWLDKNLQYVREDAMAF
jgi:hypothetical protein